ncbi:MAG: glycosyltransferase, partial [Proteobacteria bacterium]
RYSKSTFRADLHTCSGVICNAGFELPSECIHLGKRLLVKPVCGQMEQLSNACALVALGLGYRMNKLDPEILREWLQSPTPAPRPFGDVAGNIVDWILQGDLDRPQSLADRLWADVPLPPSTNRHFVRTSGWKRNTCE